MSAVLDLLMCLGAVMIAAFLVSMVAILVLFFFNEEEFMINDEDEDDYNARNKNQ